MRLTPDQIKQGILHSEQLARDTAVGYFARSYSSDPAVMPLVIQAVEQYGLDYAFGMYYFLRSLVQTEETLAWIIEQLRRRGQPQSEEEAEITLRLLEAVENAAPELLKAHAETIWELDAVDEGVREAVDEKILLAGFTTEKLWAELEEFCETNKSVEYLADEDIDFAHRLVEALGRHPGVFDSKVLELLAQEVEDYTDNPMIWMEPCLVRLAGELRLSEAIPQIVKRLHDDDDIICSDCMRSLTMIGTDQVADTLANDYPDADWGFRAGAAEVFEYIHSDHSLERCLALMETEEDPAIRCRLAQSAVMQFSDQAHEPARQLILNSDLTPDLIEVRNDLLATSVLMGIGLLEAEQWRKEAKHDVEFRKKWYAEHVPLSQFADDAEADEYLDDEDWDDDDDYIPFPPPDTVVRELPKVGRNDPCPCGSGKKYKKCCRKKGDGAGIIG